MVEPFEAVERASAELLERLETEAARLGNASATLQLGGLAKVGNKLEAFLRCIFVELAHAEGVDAEWLLQQLTKKPRAKLRRATAGELAWALADRAGAPAASHPRVRAVIDDVRLPSSCISTFIHLRNSLLHNAEGELPPSISGTVDALRRFIIAYRSALGWSREK